MRGGHFFATGSEAVELLVKGEQVQDYACNKLFLARLFNEVKFPEGKSFEDVATMFRLFLRAEHVVGIDKPLYNYLQRDSSIVHSGALKHEIDCYFAHFERYLLLSSGFPTVRWKLMDHLAHASVKVWGTALSDPDWRKYHPELREISQTVSDNRISILKHTQLGLAGRLVLRLIAYDSPCSFFLSRIIYIVYHWKNKN